MLTLTVELFKKYIVHNLTNLLNFFHVECSTASIKNFASHKTLSYASFQRFNFLAASLLELSIHYYILYYSSGKFCKNYRFVRLIFLKQLSEIVSEQMFSVDLTYGHIW